MLKDTGLKPNESSLWAWLGQAQVGLKKYDEAEATYKKVLELETNGRRAGPSSGRGNSGLGEIYARTGKIPEANAAYDAAAKANPAGAGTYLTNEAAIFSNLGTATPRWPPRTRPSRLIRPSRCPTTSRVRVSSRRPPSMPNREDDSAPGCAEAYLKYLELAPTGLYAADVKAILAEAGQTHSSVYGPDKPKKSK